MNCNKWNEFEILYKNNVSILNLFFIFILLYFSFLEFSKTKYNLSVLIESILIYS